MFEMHRISGITDGWQGCDPPPCQVKTLPSLYFGIYYYFVFSRLLFFVFSGDIGFLLSRSISDLLLFLNYFTSVSR